ncbi:MAG TPA: ABC transporter ATP-binding protein [Stellaceae bacterium]|nr:ABC transporter ATP-binding protein [Stellaceae bacterium]
MQELCRYSERPLAFIARYVRRRPLSHAAIVVAVLGAVGCSVSTQYGVKFLVDTLSQGPERARAWVAFAILVSLMAADQLLWRVASWIGSRAFVAVTGDLRSDLFRHVTGHPLRFFSERLPGMLTSRITATSNAVYTIENMFLWNVLPPCVATVAAIAYLSAVSAPLAAGLAAISGILVVALFRLAAAGKPLHHGYAKRAALVDGEMADVIGNMPIVRAFGAIRREHRRLDETVGREMAARRQSLRYLEKLRLFHACVTMALMVVLLAWAIRLWQNGAATTGQVVLVCTLGFGILHATRDLAVALVDVTQHLARLSEAVATLLVPHELSDHAEASALTRERGHVAFDDVSFHYPDGHRVFEGFSLDVPAGERVGLVGESGAGKSTLLALLQRFQDPQRGRILIDGQDVARITQETLPDAVSVVPQDVALLHRPILENIRYGRPDASDAEVVAAAAAARCLDFIDALPQGMATLVGDRGVRLSGGQRQRIAIARALLKDAPILLLDEATSALDSESEEAIIREALDRLMRGRTVIAVAHRLSTLRGFDRIVVLREGQIVQDGPPGDLMVMDGPYRRLIQREMTRLSAEAA